jgi:hypothetical protein
MVIGRLSLRLLIIIKDIMDIILVLEIIVGSPAEATIIIIKADLHSCLPIFLHVLLHLWEPVIMIVIVDIIEEAERGRTTEDRTLLAAAASYPTSLWELL